MVMHGDHARFLYNLGLEQRSMWARGRRTNPPGVYEQKRQLTQLRAELDWLAAGSTVVQQQALFDLDTAYKNFFAGRASYPQFRKRDDSRSFAVRDISIRKVSARHGLVQVPKVGWVRFRAHRDWDAYTKATSARVTRKNGHWHICFTTPPPAKITAGTGAVVGIDRGVANTIATSEGTFAQIPGLTPGEQTRFLALQRQLARQTTAAKKAGRPLRECQRRNATKAKLAALYRKLDNRRTDWVEQTTTDLARTYDLVAVEALNTTGMTKKPAPKPDPETPGVFLPNQARAKATLNKAILASRWGQFNTRLKNKLPKGRLIQVDPKNTSRTCHQCGDTDAGNRQSQAVFTCRKCSHSAHADTNAALNILARATTTLTDTPPVTREPQGYAAGHATRVTTRRDQHHRSAVNGRTSPGRAITRPRQPSKANA